MKKTLVALAVAAVAATSANAAVVYNQDGTKVEVKGSVRLLLQKESSKHGKEVTKKRADLTNNGSRLEVAASHDLGEGLKALAYGRLDLGNDDFGSTEKSSDADLKESVSLSKLYAGFSFDGVGALTFGRQATNGDDLGVSDYTYNLGGVNFVKASGNKVVRFTSATWEGFYFGVDYVFDNDAKKYTETPSGNTVTKTDYKNNRAYVLSAFYERQVGDVGIAFEAGYSNEKKTDVQTLKAFTVGAELSYGQFAFAVDYSELKTSDKKNMSFPKNPSLDGYKKHKKVELGLKYQVTEKSKVYTDVIFGSSVDEDNEKRKERTYIVGVDYKLHPQVVTYLEASKTRYKMSDSSEKGKENKVGLGLRVFF